MAPVLNSCNQASKSLLLEEKEGNMASSGVELGNNVILGHKKIHTIPRPFHNTSVTSNLLCVVRELHLEEEREPEGVREAQMM
ncbi:hypothetical protein BOTCAL_0018g00030 [Botryotinia calthae]|uniref:Uncharacterized protein n=1 Tax=Botryotinia calthae TaxID=38488 RepID=A0A4Y8DHN9_9HELO|nr:hypothetical protein BOTCAL_0018g00030 [Botryotinia calthae]